MLYYLTDSPTSQYRNASCFILVVQHKAIFNVDAPWLYFGARHGKGPEMVWALQSKGWLTSWSGDVGYSTMPRTLAMQGTMMPLTSGICESVVASDTYMLPQSHRGSRFISRLHKKTVPGTMKVHSVVCPRESEIAVCETSCYGACCYDGVSWL